MGAAQDGRILPRLEWHQIFNVHDRKLQVTLLLVILTTLYILWSRFARRGKMPPGPRPWPFIGNLLEMEQPKAIFEIFSNLAKEYGDIFSFRIGPVSYVVLNSLESIQTALVDKNCSSRPQTVSVAVFKERTEPIFMAQHNPVSMTQRKIMQKALCEYLSNGQLEKLLRSRVGECIKLIQSRDGAPVICFEYPTLITYNIVIAFMFGQVLNFDEPLFGDLMKMLDDANAVFGAGMMADSYPILAYMPNSSIKKYRKTIHHFSDHLEKSIREHREKYDPANLCDFVCHLLEAEKSIREESRDDDVMAQVNDKHLAGILADIFFAGTDAFRLTLIWIFGLCAQYPEVQRRIHNELNKVVGDDEALTFAHCEKLSYLQAVVNETLRLYPVLPVAVPHVTTEDVKLSEYTIRKGTYILPNIWKLHHDPEVWEEPNLFNPNRWLDEDSSLVNPPAQFMPFSLGGRACPASAISRKLIQFLTAALLQHVAFEPPLARKDTFRLRMVPAGFICLPRPHTIVASLRKKV